MLEDQPSIFTFGGSADFRRWMKTVSWSAVMWHFGTRWEGRLPSGSSSARMGTTMKKIVETIGPFQLMGSGAGEVDAVPFDRPAVVVATAYIQFKAAQGVLRIVADAPESATDADFAKFWDEDATRSNDAVKSIGRVQG